MNRGRGGRRPASPGRRAQKSRSRSPAAEQRGGFSRSPSRSRSRSPAYNRGGKWWLNHAGPHAGRMMKWEEGWGVDEGLMMIITTIINAGDQQAEVAPGLMFMMMMMMTMMMRRRRRG